MQNAWRGVEPFALEKARADCYRPRMIKPPETVYTDSTRVSCDGATEIRGGPSYSKGALGHPRVWLEIDEKGFVECGYCDRRFVLRGGAADGGDAAAA